MTKQELENNILAAVEELRVARSRLEPLAKDWALADTEYRKAHARAYCMELGTVADKKAKADKESYSEMLKAHELDASREAVRDNVKALMVEISAYQTLAGLLKSEMAHLQYEP